MKDTNAQPESGGTPSVVQSLLRLDRPAVFQSLKRWLSVDNLIHRLLATFCQILLRVFCGLEDAFLAITALRKLVAFALAPRCQAAVLRGLQRWQSISHDFESLPYFVSDSTKQLLLHAGVHALAWQPNQQGSEGLPGVGRILLQTAGSNTGCFQEAVAAALAKRLHASLLIVDDALLAAVAKDALGGPLERGGIGKENAGGLFTFFLSFWLSGGKVAFVWDVILRVAASVDGPLVVFVRDVEQTICASYERCDAFMEALGAGQVDDLEAECGPLPFVLVGGCALSDTGAQLTAPGQGKAGGAEAAGLPPGLAGAGDDALPGLLPAAAELALAMAEEQPNPRKMLAKLFVTRVQLQAPLQGAAAVRHYAQLQRDSDELLAQHSYTTLAALAAARRVKPPPASAAIYRQRRLTQAEWVKALSWALSMEQLRQRHLQAKQRQQQQQQQQQDPASPVASPLPVSSGPSSAGIRRSRSACGSAGYSLDVVQAANQQLGAASLAVKLLASTSRAFKPLAPLRTKPDTSQATHGDSSVHSPADSGQDAEMMVLSEQSLWYGFQMLQKTGSSIRQQVRTDNVYERRLLSEVIRPEDGGMGFLEVGALDHAKQALREAVQLPLQHPHLFARGSLARPCKGVLLFGPPGTGKTLLAKAAAAECGASFLAIHPSTVASKWLGDGVRYVRAVFSLAAKLSPCVLFVDEVDALLGRRNSHSEHEALREMKNEFMAQWDGIRGGGGGAATGASGRLMVLGATNRPQDLDEAVLRRFSRRIFCDLPNRGARRSILQVLLEGEALADDVDLDAVAGATEGFSGSDLRHLCTTAAMRPLRDLLAASGKSAAVAGIGCLKAPTKQTSNAVGKGAASGQEQQQPLITSTSGDGGQLDDLYADDKAISKSNHAFLPSTLQDSQPIVGSNDRALVVGGSASDEQAGSALLQSLLQDCDSMAAAASSSSSAQLRPLSAEDFAAARKDVTPTVSPDSMVMSELQQWNQAFGEGAKRDPWNPKLTMYI